MATMLTTPFLWTVLTMFMVLITMIRCIMPIMLVIVISVGFRLKSGCGRCGLRRTKVAPRKVLRLIAGGLRDGSEEDREATSPAT